MKLKLTPLQQITFFLGIYATTAIFFNFSKEIIFHLLATVGFGVILFFIFKKISGQPKIIYNTLTTSLIIFLVCHHFLEPNNIIFPLVATFSAIFSKFFLIHKGMPIFNPAAFGILLGLFITKIPGLSPGFVSWWGVSFQGYVSLALIAIWILFGLKTWKKWPIVIIFLLTHFAYLAFTNLETLKFVATNATIYFLATVMLIEPKTSPFSKKEQIIYVLIAALTYNLLFHFKIAYFEIYSILTANFYYFLSKR